jgi:hypothetical protein
MRVLIFVAAALMTANLPAAAASAPKAPPTDKVTAKPACASDSAEYVPGVDAYGRPVAPADLPGGADVQISTEIYAELRSKNPQLRGAGVDVNLPGLETRPPCPPQAAATPTDKPR